MQILTNETISRNLRILSTARAVETLTGSVRPRVSSTGVSLVCLITGLYN